MNPTTEITLVTTDAEPRVSSLEIAARLGIQHENSMSLIRDYQEDFDVLGAIRFETGTTTPNNPKPPKYALLNEDQAYLLLTYSRNTDQARACKLALVKAFKALREIVIQPDLSDPLTLALHTALENRRAVLALENRVQDMEAAREAELEITPINGVQAGQIYHAVHAIARSGQLRHAVIWGALKERHGVASYRDIPRAQFSAALGYLNDWYERIRTGQGLWPEARR